MVRKIKVAPVDPVPLTCGVCRFLRNDGKSSPSCYVMPPQLVVDGDGDLNSIRPIVRLEDQACSLHQPRLNS